MMKLYPKLASTVVLASLAYSSQANEFNPDISVVLDGLFESRDNALGGSAEGFSLGHTELTIESPIDDKFYGRLTSVLESHGSETELSLEEAYMETTSLPYGLKVKAGRFLSNIGYLNNRHTHEDDFAKRPAVYRALLGGHYYDDGVQLSYLVPTDFYWQLSSEVFNGQQLAGQSHDESVGVATFGMKIGGDLNVSNSWQLGVSYLYNDLTNLNVEDEDHDETSHDHDHAGHTHSAGYTGRHLYMTDFVWKWAPSGNSKQKQVTVSAELMQANNINQFSDSDVQLGWYLASSYKFDPSWKVAARIGQVDLSEVHGNHFHYQKMDEANLALTWSTSHFSLLRLMYTYQDSEEFNDADDAITVQYQMVLGAHGAHQF